MKFDPKYFLATLIFLYSNVIKWALLRVSFKKLYVRKLIHVHDKTNKLKRLFPIDHCY